MEHYSNETALLSDGSKLLNVSRFFSVRDVQRFTASCKGKSRPLPGVCSIDDLVAFCQKGSVRARMSPDNGKRDKGKTNVEK
jgi:hypothetical protein